MLPTMHNLLTELSPRGDNNKIAVKEIIRDEIRPAGTKSTVSIQDALRTADRATDHLGVPRVDKIVFQTLQNVLPPGDVGEYVGAGAHSSVFEFKPDFGPLMVVKIGDDDTKPYDDVYAIRGQLPELHSRHLPKIFGVWELALQNTTLTVILMEHLSKLPISIQNALDGFFEYEEYHGHEPDWSKWIADDANIAAYVYEGIFRLHSIIPNLYAVVADELIPQIRKRWRFSETPPTQAQAEAFAGLIANLLVQLHPEHASEIKRLTQFMSHTWTSAAATAVMLPTSKPTDSREMERHFDYLSKTGLRTFYATLEYISSKHNVDWHDLKTDNIMMRAGTNDVVVSDIGEFV